MERNQILIPSDSTNQTGPNCYLVGNGHIVKKNGKGVKLSSDKRGNGFHGDNIKDDKQEEHLEMHGWDGVPDRSMIQKIYQILVLHKGVYEGDFCRKYTYKTQLPMDKNFEKAKISAVRSKNDGDVIVTITGFERKDVIFKVVDEGDGDAQGQSHGEHGKGGGKDKCDGEGVA
ncbi:hypothetical protein Tco_1095053 [Tanacetum coccineum]